MQTGLTYLVVTVAIGYALWRAHQTIRRANNPCYGCSGCALKEQKQVLKKKKKDCWHKK